MTTGHQVPADMRTEPGVESDRPPVPEPSHSERARTLAASTNRGILSTLAVDPAGYPFGSVATYALDDLGRPIVFVSTMAEHTRNAAADGRASLIATEAVPEGSDPLAVGRVTLIGDLERVVEDERLAVRERYLAVNPTSAYYIDFGDFSFWRLELRSIRYVGGFGRMSWVDVAGYSAAEPDPLAPMRAGVIEHMNADHADSLLLFAQHFAGRTEATSAVMTGVDRYGFDIVAQSPDTREALRIGFGSVLGDPAEVRPEMVRLVQEAREAGATSV